MELESDNKCPRCGEGRLREWSKLTDEEQEVVQRLPGARDYPPEERQKAHRWCKRCWHESAGDEELQT